MALIVKELNMPTCCDDCEFCIKDWDYDEAFCSASTHIQWRNLMLVPHNHRHLDCPLIEIPSGSKLVDANELIDKSEWYGERATYNNPMPDGVDAVSVEDIENTTVIYEEESCQ